MVLCTWPQLKEALLSKAAEVDRGLKETPADREVILGLIKELEAKNPTKKPNTSPLVSARWRLVYTTSDSILGKTRPAPFRPAGDILQVSASNVASLRREEAAVPDRLSWLPFVDRSLMARRALSATRSRCARFHFSLPSRRLSMVRQVVSHLNMRFHRRARLEATRSMAFTDEVSLCCLT